MYAVYPKASEEHWSCFSPVWNPVAHKAFRVWQQAALVLRQDAFLLKTGESLVRNPEVYCILIHFLRDAGRQ
jgi:hypothetical protein